jgi:hypothetical protein
MLYLSSFFDTWFVDTNGEIARLKRDLPAKAIIDYLSLAAVRKKLLINSRPPLLIRSLANAPSGSCRRSGHPRPSLDHPYDSSVSDLIPSGRSAIGIEKARTLCEEE